jgi:hypothetical protein
VLRLWLVKLIPFVSRWTEAAPAACCGHCAPCVTATVSALSAETINAHTTRA